ncbi:MAG: FMN-binding protein [Gammaproteobacteria bacterium]|nr:FMN-binding protein [Gammaproteobacteria bacterium]
MHTVRSLFMLSIVATLCGIMLVATKAFTAEQITSNHNSYALKTIEHLLQQKVPATFSLTDLPYGKCDNYIVSLISAAGYVGEIQYLTVWRAQQDTLSMRVVRHSETPGIGDFIDHQRSSWITQFDFESAQAFATLDGVSGATVTSNSVRRAAISALKTKDIYCE